MISCTFENKKTTSLRHVTVDVLVVKGNKILLVKRATGLLEAGKWASVGGFVDRGETVIQAAAREVLEESGWKIKNLQLLRIKDNPDRPHEDRQNISFTFFCEGVEKVGERDDESDEIKWFSLDMLPDATMIAFDHAADIELYKKYLKKPFSIPVSIL